jgi:hypothetical protein
MHQSGEIWGVAASLNLIESNLTGFEACNVIAAANFVLQITITIKINLTTTP